MSDGGAQRKVFGPFFDSDGDIYRGIRVKVYSVGTTNAKTYWTDEDKTTAVNTGNLDDSDSDGIVSAFFDGDYRFQVKQSDGTSDLDDAIDWDSFKVTSDTATMWEGNFGTSYPSATTANRWHQFAKVSATNEFIEMGINNGSSFVTFSQIVGKGADVVSEAALFTTAGFPRDGNYFDVTGTTGITSILTSGKVGTEIKLHFDAALTITHHATDLVLPNGEDITTVTGGVNELEFVEYSSGDWRLIPGTTISHNHATSGVGGGLSLFTGTGLKNVSANFDNLKIEQKTVSTVDIDADSVIVYDTNGVSYKLGTFDKTADITASGVDGLDTGAEADVTWYHIFVIAKTDGTMASLLSTSDSFPSNFPSGYTLAAYAGAIYNKANDFVTLRQIDNQAWIDTGSIGNDATTNTTVSALDISAFVPSTAKKVNYNLELATGEDIFQMHPETYTKGGVQAAFNIFDNNAANNVGITFECPIWTSQQVYTSISTAGTAIIHFIGWGF
jgi:hypothetical protein